MNPILRLGHEIGQLSGCLAPRDFARFVGHLAARSPSIARTKSLVPADLAMEGELTVMVRGAKIVVPLSAIRALLEKYDPTPTFGAIREMYASDVYLRAFKRDLRAETVLDLGSNRGLFLLLGAQVLKAKLAIGVEPQTFYDRAFDALVKANNLPKERFARVGKLAASAPGPDSITVPEIMTAHGLSSIRFMKCDIEGAEFDVVGSAPSFLSAIDNIAMELHPDKGDVQRLVGVLEAAGFIVRVTDQFGRNAAPVSGHYLYASRTSELAVAR